VHAAVHWLLGKWNVDRSNSTGTVGGGATAKEKKWYTNSAGHTMVQIAGPVDFIMGSPPDETGRHQDENRHNAAIGYSYEIAMTETTIAQFRRFLKDADFKKDYSRLENLQADWPVSKVTWYDAVAYCDWLNKLEKIPPDQWCYQPNQDGQFAEGMKIVADYQRRTGYRLPTETEWEYACRGGASTSRFYGDANELLPRYAWINAPDPDVAVPVASLRPNPFGLFDMLGNATEWCQNPMLGYGEQEPGQVEIVLNSRYRSVRGGSMMSQILYMRSAKRFSDRPTLSNGGGFRVARSRP
jgi:formylglycine-generating enzyme required for sulfatase activity